MSEMADTPTPFTAPAPDAPTNAPASAPLVHVVEALLFASDAPVEASRLQEVLGLGAPADARELVEALRQRLEADGRALQVVEVGGGFRLVTRPEVAPWLVKLARSRTRSRLSRPALETLAIVAYRQPVSRPEVDAVRGVNSEGVLDNLLDRRMVRIAGRKDSPGRPFLYETTRDFLVAFGLRDLADLPKPDGDLIVPEIHPADSETDPAPDDAQPELPPTDATPVATASAPPDSAPPESGTLGATASAPPEPTPDPAGAESPSAPDAHQQDPGPGGSDVPARG